MAAVNLGTRSAEVTVSATTLMVGFRFSNSANRALRVGPAGSSPKYQLMKRSWMGCCASPGPGAAPPASSAVAAAMVSRRHQLMDGLLSRVGGSRHLSAPAVRPETRKRDVNMYNTMGGMAATMPAAMSSFQATLYSPKRCAIPTLIVYFSLESVST